MQSGSLSSFGGNSLTPSVVQLSFDVAKETDVIALLKYIHQHPIEPDTKNTLRDYIFSYRQDSSQASFVILQQACASIGVLITTTPFEINTLNKEVVGTRFNTGRPLPSFKNLAQISKITSIQTEVPLKAVEEVSVNTVQLRKIVVPKFEVKPLSQTPQSIPEPIVVPTPIAVVEKENTQAATPILSPVDIATIQARISEIKHLVNAKVGNPVNLIETHNEVGRFYMNALLDAMKKGNAGAQGELTTAMVILEEAYVKVMHTLGDSPIVAESATATTTDQSVNIPMETPTQPTPVSSIVSAASSPITATQVPIVLDEERAKRLQVKLEDLNNRNIEKKPVVNSAQTAVSESVLSTPSYDAPRDVGVSTQPVLSRDTASDTAGLPSVAKNKQLQDLLRANREKEFVAHQKEEEASIKEMDPLDTPEVSAGLAQLLSEWTLFRSSGFFGTGPSGKDHALFQKLSPLTMASVIAGRFEGSTPLIKQSIADYMNGWRYEEGIVHEHGETFEHYLRKVVYHIIEKKKSALIRK